MKIYTYTYSLNTMVVMIEELLKNSNDLILVEAQNIIWESTGGPTLGTYDAIHYEDNHVICVDEGANPDESDWFAFPISQVAVSPKRFHPEGHENEYHGQINLNGYFKANLPQMPKVRVRINVPSLDQIQQLQNNPNSEGIEGDDE